MSMQRQQRPSQISGPELRTSTTNTVILGSRLINIMIHSVPTHDPIAGANRFYQIENQTHGIRQDQHTPCWGV